LWGACLTLKIHTVPRLGRSQRLQDNNWQPHAGQGTCPGETDDTPPNDLGLTQGPKYKETNRFSLVADDCFSWWARRGEGRLSKGHVIWRSPLPGYTFDSLVSSALNRYYYSIEHFTQCSGHISRFGMASLI
jgi:hypothetical protein